MANSTVIRFDQRSEQKDGPIKRIIGFVKPKNFIAFFDTVTLDANPRSAKANRVTKDIISSIEDNPSTFQFKTKGILMGTRGYEPVDDGKSYKLHFQNKEFEGLLDGGHNMLALGTYMLGRVLTEAELKKIRYWRDILKAWGRNKDRIKRLQGEFGFKVPVEILVPANMNDPVVVEDFTDALIEICAARNNNSQLTTETMDNRKGLYDEVEKCLPDGIRERVEWRTNEWENPNEPPIKALRIIPIAWLPLGLLDDHKLLPRRAGRKWIDLENAAQSIYSTKGTLSKKFGDLMQHEGVSSRTKGSRYEMHNASVLSALKILGKLPELHDMIFSRIIEAYIQAGGKEKLLEAVKKRPTRTPYTNEPSRYDVPLGYIMPVLFGLKALMHVKGKEVVWKHNPTDFLAHNMDRIGQLLMEVFENLDTYDPQKVGKNIASYKYMLREMRKLLD